MFTRPLLAASLLAVLLAPIGCATAAGEESPADENTENTAKTDEALSFPSFKPPVITIPTPDFTPITDAIARGNALAQNGIAGADGFTRLVLAPLNEKAVVFRAANDAVTVVANGFAVRGELTLDTPSGPLSFGSADATFEWGPDHSIGLAHVHGSVDLPFPGVGALKGVEVSSLAKGQIGYDIGSAITGVEAPIAKDRHYLYVDLATGIEAKSGIVTFTAPGGKALRALLDPTDPSLFFKGNVAGLGNLGKIEDLAVGVSAKGLIPFTPKVTWGIEDQVKNMSGHLFVSGSLPLSRYPLSIDGEIVVNVDPDNTGKYAFTSDGGGLAIAANGTVNVKVDYIPTLDFSFPVVNATLGGKVTATEQYAYFSGEGNSDIKWIPTIIPLRPAGSAKIAGLVHSNTSKSFLKAEGKYTLATTVINDALKLGLSDIDFATAKMQVDKNGFRLQGSASTPIHASLAPKGTIAFDTFFSGQANNWYVQMNGDFAVAGFPIATATATVSPSGLTVNGSYQTPISSVFMQGSITNAGPSLQGTATVTIPVVAPKIVQKLEKAAQCGTVYAKNALECGQDEGENAAECGEKTITNGATCGWNVVKSAISCAASGFKNCKTPKSCKVANYCTWTNACTFTKTCNVDTTDPAFSFGTFTGTVHVNVGSGGASGSLTGQFCPTGGGACIALPSTSVQLGASPKACISGVPGANGTFCAAF